MNFEPVCPDNPFPVLHVAFGFLICFVLFYFSKFFSQYIPAYKIIQEDNEKEKWNVKVVSLIHAIMTLVGATWCLLDQRFWTDKVCGYSHFAQFFLAFTTGYMIYDIYVSIKAYGLTMSGILPPLLLHHLNIVFSFVNALYFSLGFYFPLWFMTNELSQPFLHGSWFMMKSKVPKTHPISIVNGLLIVITFLGSRFIVNTYVWYELLLHTKSISPFNAKGIGGLTGTIHLLVNYYWCYLVILQLIDMLSAKKKDDTKIE